MFKYYSTTFSRKKKLFGAILALVFMAGFLGETAHIMAGAESATGRAWVICQPGDWVNARRSASTRSESIGRLETGYPLNITGKTKNGFAQAVGLTLEEDSGWIYAGYLVFEEPVWQGGATGTVRANGRVACRKYVDGPRRCWVTDGSRVRVYWLAGEWAVTDKGFIRSEYLEVGT